MTATQHALFTCSSSSFARLAHVCASNLSVSYIRAKPAEFFFHVNTSFRLSSSSASIDWPYAAAKSR
jgi:hypothetical protein